MLGDGDDVGTRDLGNSNATVGSVGSVQVNMVGADASGDGELQVLRLSETLGSQVARVEAMKWWSVRVPDDEPTAAGGFFFVFGGGVGWL